MQLQARLNASVYALCQRLAKRSERSLSAEAASNADDSSVESPAKRFSPFLEPFRLRF